MSTPHSAPTTTTPSNSRPKAIIFDLLTALLDSWTAWDRAVSSTLPPTTSSSSPSPSPSHTTTQLAHAWRQTYLSLTYTTGAYTPYATLVHTAAQLTTPALPAPSAAADALLENYVSWLAPWPEAGALLRRLKGAGYALAVATNCSDGLGRGAAGLFDEDGNPPVFDFVVTAEESGWYKPARGAYAAVLERLGLRADEVLFVAGSAADVPGARGAGIKRVVWHNRVGMEAKPGAEGMAEREGRTLGEVLEGVVL
ncbi:(S)-2-haloacid dehalogenase 4A [Diplodia seriata]|uniref:(S)-2-haloacid dehalogenase 4A n=1 Tax=Diplodia seriata TaxID=420778 RepID=A0A1S8B820_9PEZI|nr:(S)-2-haloacid dehalogenase 4A [Diplodia seriata]